MNKIGIFATLVILFLASCGKKSELETKKEELSKAKKEVSDLQIKIKKLETEVASLDTTSGTEIKIKTIAATPVQSSVFRHYVSVQGSLEAEENLMITSKIPGQITSVKVKEGDMVRQGQIVAVLDDEVIR